MLRYVTLIIIINIKNLLISFFIVGMIINNEHKQLCRAFDRLLNSETPWNYVHCTGLGFAMIAYHIIRALAEVRTRAWYLYTCEIA